MNNNEPSYHNLFLAALRASKAIFYRVPLKSYLNKKEPIVDNSHFIYDEVSLKNFLGYERSAFNIKFTDNLNDKVIHPDDIVEVSYFYLNFLEELKIESKIDLIYRIKNPLGQYRWFRDCSTIIVNKNGKPESLAGLLTCIHEEEVVKDNLQKSLNNIENFTTALTHDLKQPVITCFGYLNILKSCVNFSDPIEKESFEYIYNSITDIDNLITELHNLLKVNKNHQIREVVRLKPIILSLVQDIRNNHNNLDIKLPFTYPTILGHYSDFRALFFNLLYNAAKYQKLDPKKDYKPSVSIKIKEEEKYLTITFYDNGQGIKAIYLDKIYNPFFRVQASSTDKGTGLGLTIVKSIVDKYNGTITCDSVYGHYTIFTIKLPRTIVI